MLSLKSCRLFRTDSFKPLSNAYMAFGQLTHRESLSNPILCLKTNVNKMYHLGIGDVVAKSTLSVANENRSYRIYYDLAMLLIKQAKELYVGGSNLEVALENNVFAIDATTIDLCLSTFHWTTFRSTKAGIKLHTQLDLKTDIPELIHFFSLHKSIVLTACFDDMPTSAATFFPVYSSLI